MSSTIPHNPLLPSSSSQAPRHPSSVLDRSALSSPLSEMCPEPRNVVLVLLENTFAMLGLFEAIRDRHIPSILGTMGLSAQTFVMWSITSPTESFMPPVLLDMMNMANPWSTYTRDCPITALAIGRALKLLSCMSKHHDGPLSRHLILIPCKNRAAHFSALDLGLLTGNTIDSVHMHMILPYTKMDAYSHLFYQFAYKQRHTPMKSWRDMKYSTTFLCSSSADPTAVNREGIAEPAPLFRKRPQEVETTPSVPSHRYPLPDQSGEQSGYSNPGPTPSPSAGVFSDATTALGIATQATRGYAGTAPVMEPIATFPFPTNDVPATVGGAMALGNLIEGNDRLHGVYPGTESEYQYPSWYTTHGENRVIPGFDQAYQDPLLGYDRPADASYLQPPPPSRYLQTNNTELLLDSEFEGMPFSALQGGGEQRSVFGSMVPVAMSSYPTPGPLLPQMSSSPPNALGRRHEDMPPDLNANADDAHHTRAWKQPQERRGGAWIESRQADSFSPTVVGQSSLGATCAYAGADGMVSFEWPSNESLSPDVSLWVDSYSSMGEMNDFLSGPVVDAAVAAADETVYLPMPSSSASVVD